MSLQLRDIWSNEIVILCFLVIILLYLGRWEIVILLYHQQSESYPGSLGKSGFPKWLDVSEAGAVFRNFPFFQNLNKFLQARNGMIFFLGQQIYFPQKRVFKIMIPSSMQPPMKGFIVTFAVSFFWGWVLSTSGKFPPGPQARFLRPRDGKVAPGLTAADHLYHLSAIFLPSLCHLCIPCHPSPS